MRANEFITEVFEPGKQNWSWAFRGSEEAVADFKVGEVPYRFHAYYNGTDDWEVEFKVNTPNNSRDSRENLKTRFGLTGTGNSAEVMSTVVDIMREFLQMYHGKIDTIGFTASEPSRQKLYMRMMKRLLPNWDIHTYSADSGSGLGFTVAAPDNLEEEIIDEMPLPADWDPQQYKQQTSTFKSRLAYALERAKKLGTGSSRVATVIEYQGRPTVLKIAKNAKGLSQNSVEADILSDGYASQLGILIPIIDYDEQNREPSWIHTEMATKASEKQLCNMMKCDNLHQLVNMAYAITGKKRYVGTYQSYIDHMQQAGKSEQDIETMSEYANTLADLNSNFDIELADFARAANWGIYQGKPVIIDAGFNSNVLSQYYSR